MCIPNTSSNLLAVYGHVGFDVSTLAGKTSRTPGGAAYYAAMAAAAQGVDVTLISVLGTDFPEASLNLRRIDLSASVRSPRTSAVFTQTYNGQNEVIAFNNQLNACADISPRLIPLNAPTPSAVLLATAPPRQQAQALEWLISQNFQGLIAIDTTLTYVAAFDHLLRQYGNAIGALFVNEAEYKALAQHPPPCKRTIVKRGNQGAFVLENGACTYISTRRVAEVFTVTGAGDVLAGAFLAAETEGCSTAEALARAVTFATNYVESGPACFNGNSVGDPK